MPEKLLLNGIKTNIIVNLAENQLRTNSMNTAIVKQRKKLVQTSHHFRNQKASFDFRLNDSFLLRTIVPTFQFRAA